MNDVIALPIFIPGERTGHMEKMGNLIFRTVPFKLTDLASRHIASSSHTERICLLRREHGSQEAVFQ